MKVQVRIAPGEEPLGMNMTVEQLRHFMGLLQMTMQSQLFGFETELTLTKEER